MRHLLYKIQQLFHEKVGPIVKVDIEQVTIVFPVSSVFLLILIILIWLKHFQTGSLYSITFPSEYITLCSWILSKTKLFLCNVT